MSVQEHRVDPDQASSRTTFLLLSWLCLLAIPAGFFVGFAAAHLPGVWFNVAEGEDGPWYYSLCVVLLLLGFTWAPVGLSLLLGRRAVRAGSRAAWVPVVIGLMLTTLTAVLLVVSIIFG